MAAKAKIVCSTLVFTAGTPCEIFVT